MRTVLALIIALTFISCGKQKPKPTKQEVIASKSICGKDDRLPSYDLRVARALSSETSSGGCTITMISPNCAVSAAHCVNSLNIFEFNTPPSKDGKIQNSDIEDVYTRKKDTLTFEDNGIGDDWAVFELAPSAYHGHSAGDMQGYYGVDWGFGVESTQLIRIAGYGLDVEPDRNLAQQQTTGNIVRTFNSMLYHNVDTMGGNSGSSIIDVRGNRVIGVHTHGGCGVDANAGTLIAKNKNISKRELLLYLDLSKSFPK